MINSIVTPNFILLLSQLVRFLAEGASPSLRICKREGIHDGLENFLVRSNDKILSFMLYY